MRELSLQETYLTQGGWHYDLQLFGHQLSLFNTDGQFGFTLSTTSNTSLITLTNKFIDINWSPNDETIFACKINFENIMAFFTH